MNQSRRQSLIESATQTTIGYLSSIVLQILIYSHFNVSLDLRQQSLIALSFTAVGFVRGYYLRRFFNWLYNKDTL